MDPRSARVSLTQHEAAFVLQRTRRDVRNMVRRGDLRAVQSGRRRDVDVDACRALLEGQPLAFEVLLGIVEGRYTAPPASGKLDAAPVALTWAMEHRR